MRGWLWLQFAACAAMWKDAPANPKNGGGGGGTQIADKPAAAPKPAEVVTVEVRL